jgi:hypothetical protein
VVRALSWGNAVSLSTAEYLGVPSACYAGVIRGRAAGGLLRLRHLASGATGRSLQSRAAVNQRIR